MNARERRLYRILARYLSRSEAGEAIDPAELVRCHPEFAAEFKEYFDNHAWLERVVAGLRPET